MRATLVSRRDVSSRPRHVRPPSVPGPHLRAPGPHDACMPHAFESKMRAWKQLNSRAVCTQPHANVAWHACRRHAKLCRTPCAAATSTAGAPAASLFDEWYQQPARELRRSMGAIKVVTIEGKGRGVVSTQDLSPGDLIMISEPLALLTQPEGQRIEAEGLVDWILEQGRHKHRWFQDYFYDGSSKSVRLVPDLSLRPEEQRQASMAVHPAVKRLTKKGSSASGAFGANVRAALAGRKKSNQEVAEAEHSSEQQGQEQDAGPSSQSEVSVFPGGVDRATARRVARTVKYNCFGDAYQDKAASHLRGEALTAHIGVWPEMSMLNHSCSPNAINYVIGDVMVVRAACPIRAGDEVTISYLGRPQLMPVEPRVEYLQENYGFSCECERCTAELIHIDKFETQYEALYDEVNEELGPLFEMAKAQSDLETICTVRDRLRKAVANLYATFRKTALLPEVRLFYTASLYDVLELQLACETVALSLEKEQAAASSGTQDDQDLSESEAAANSVLDQTLAQCVKAVAEVTPGSDLHAILTARYLRRMVDRHGQASAKTQAAHQLAVEAHVIRYGPISTALGDQLMELNRTLYD